MDDAQDIKEAVADLRRCIELGADDEWIVGFVRQYPFNKKAQDAQAPEFSKEYTTGYMIGHAYGYALSERRNEAWQELSAPAGDALDAARYRWLRDKAILNNESLAPVVVMLYKHGEHGEPLDFIAGYELDNEIDQARNEKGGT